MKKLNQSKSKRQSNKSTTAANDAPIPEIKGQSIPLTEIDFSPFNYRYAAKPVDESTLQELAASIKANEVVQAVLVRPLAENRYELVVGERRLRASLIAGKATIPCIIRELTDEQVKEIQLIENLHRENPHPMAEAMGFHELLHLRTKKNSVKEIAAQVGKSESYVYQRLKLNGLIEDFRQMYVAGSLTSVQALKLASLDAGSQEEFFEQNCKDWESNGWASYNFDYRIKNYQLDFSEAPFDVKDAKLDKEAGACTKCPHNTAVISSLFPDESDQARCTNRPCFDNKSKMFQLLNFAVVVSEHPELPIAVEDEEVLAQFFAIDDKLIKGRTVLVSGVDFSDFDKMEDKPKREAYRHWDEEEGDEAFQDALAEYEEEFERMEEEAKAGNYLKAILIAEEGLGSIVYLYNQAQEQEEEDEDHVSTSQRYQPAVEYKAKDYQEALKSKTLTLEHVEGEKTRLIQREARSKELDAEKLQEAFYDALQNSNAVKEIDTPAGTYDMAALLMVVYDKLSYSAKQKVTSVLLGDSAEDEDEDSLLIRFFIEANESERSVFTRIALLDNTSVKYPNSVAGAMLKKVVEQTPGVNSEILVIAQRQKCEEREEVLSEKISKLNRQAEKLKAVPKEKAPQETEQEERDDDQHQLIESAA